MNNFSVMSLLDEIQEEIANCFAVGYGVEKILLVQHVSDAINAYNESLVGGSKGKLEKLFGCPVEIDDEVEKYKLVVRSGGHK